MRGQRRRADQAHQESRGVEDGDFEHQRRADRQAEVPQRAKARPVGAPEAAEQAIATKPAVGQDDDCDQQEHQAGGEGRGEAGADQAEFWHPEMAEDQAPCRQGIGDHAAHACSKCP